MNDFPCEEKWSDLMPSKPGLWKIKCMETDNVPQFVAVTRRDGRLLVHDEHLGITPLKAFHDGLTNLFWFFVA